MSVPLSVRSSAWRSLALPGTLVVLDFDGTLAPIVRDRDAARLPAATRAALEAVAARYPVAILSGRSAADVSARLDGIRVRWVIGSHGAEWPGRSARARAWRQRVSSWRRKLARRLRGEAGVEIESKGLSLAVHFRRAPRPAGTSVRVACAAADLDGATLVGGKRVWNVVPSGAGDKGTALRRLAVVAGARRLLFVGDDVTDEAAFGTELPIPAVTVRVGSGRDTRARFHVLRRSDVDHLLDSLADLRGQHGASAERR